MSTALLAGLWGLLAASTLLIGAAIGSLAPVIMAFGAGVLISALAFDPMDAAFARAGYIRSDRSHRGRGLPLRVVLTELGDDDPIAWTSTKFAEARVMLHSLGMSKTIGATTWAIAEGYIPAWSHGPEPEFTSHETACILNTNDKPAHIECTIYFKDREPAGPYRITVEARRTKHVRFNELNDPQPIPKGTDYSSVFVSDVPVVIQHTRLDSRQSENALLTTIAYAAD